MTATAILAPVSLKACTKCGEVKPATTEFFSAQKGGKFGVTSKCKTCVNADSKSHHSTNRDCILAGRAQRSEEINARRRLNYIKNKDIISARNKQYIAQNPEATKARKNAWYQENKERIAEVRRENAESLRQKSKAYKEKNREKVLAQKRVHMKMYNANNKEKVRESKRKTLKIRRETDSLYRLKRNTATLIRMKLSSGGYKKKSRTHEILGCEWEFFKSHLERQFLRGMSWENRSEWHIDHIIPTSKAENEEDAIRLNHFTNLRPMWASENIAKSDRVLTLL